MAAKSFDERFPKTKSLLESATRTGVFPSYAVGVYHERADQSEWFDYHGCGSRSLFDLASLSKPLCTVTLVAMAEERKRLSIEAPVQDFFPAFSDRRVTLRHLLTHSSGLPAWLPLHDLFHEQRGTGLFDPCLTPREARARYEKEIIQSHQPGQLGRTAYSDLGFMLLGWILEKALGKDLDALFQEWLAHPFELLSLQFLPTTSDVVPTEDCPWRGHVLRGEVHDDNCFVLGGVAGHAGLFGRVTDVVGLGRLWLDAYQGMPTLFSTETARRYWAQEQSTGAGSSTWALGWDGVSKQGSSAGLYFSAAARGHLGYTGTSLWIDPEKNLIVALLTNRVHPTRTNEKIKEFRPVFHDTFLEELGVAK